MKKVFPDIIDNNYNGHKIPLYFFYLLTAITVGRSLVHIFAVDGGAQSIASIPLKSYSTPASDVIIHIFAEWGLVQLLFGLLYIIVLWKYKSLISLMYLFIIIEYSFRLFLTLYKPIILAGKAPGGIGNYVLIPLTLIMFILSITNTNQKLSLKK